VELSSAKHALEFYANQDNYPKFTVTGQGRGGVIQDKGSQARRALQALRQPTPTSFNHLFKKSSDWETM
jgi:hypothetical protein